MITVHHLDNSRSQRVLWLLEELGLPYEIRHYKRDPATMLAPASLREVHPLGKSPVVADADVTLAESGAIIEYLVEHYGGDASRVWTDASDGRDLQARLLALPSIGDMKARSLIAILGKRFGLDLPGLDEVMPRHPTLGDVDSAEALASYQAGKRAWKAAHRAASG